MDTDKNASLTPKGREAMGRSVVEGGQSKALAARPFKTTPKTVAKWVDRFQAEGPAGLMDRSSRPHSSPDSSPGQTPPATCARRSRLCSRQRHIGAQIAAEVGVSFATVSRILKRLGLHRLSALEPAEPVRRYERLAPGEIIHIDIKKLGKFNRIGHRIPGDRFFRSLGVRVERVMTDNGSSFRSRRYAKALRRLKIKHLPTKPYTPKTNGKTERFVQTSLREWAYAHA
jgi:transposase InsO family protein